METRQQMSALQANFIATYIDMGAKLNFREAKRELDRMIEESRNNLNKAQVEEGTIHHFFRGQHQALVELKYYIQGVLPQRRSND